VRQRAFQLIEALWFQQLLLFGGCFLVLLRTMIPTLYTLDSAEFAIGAETLGIAHAPGYALYLVLAHLFARLPVGDISYRVNLFSAFSLALAAPCLYRLLLALTPSRLASASATLMCMWSYYVWTAGIVAEVYAAQIATLALLGWALAARFADDAPPPLATVGIGALFGLAVAMHPSSILFAPGIAAAFRLRGIGWRASLLAALAGALIVAASLLYFPIRYQTDPALNLAGSYDAAGVFRPVDLRTVRGLWWLLSGQQFDNLFFAAGILPTPARIGKLLSLFWGNFLGIGVIAGIIGVIVLYQTRRKLLWAWLALALPYTYFYATYGAADFDTMFGPSYALWTIMIAFGLRWLLDQLPSRGLRASIALGLPLILCVVNFPLLDLSDDTTVRDKAERIMAALPDDAIVFGQWWDIVPLQYLHIVEDQRPDLTLRNLFLFEKDSFDAYWARLLSDSQTPVVLLGNDTSRLPDTVPVSMTPITIQAPGASDNQLIVAGFIFVSDGGVRSPAPASPRPPN
jgi:hypothetical protein